ncbi:pilus assembly protein TadG-related protein [Glutamicibacter nicotianae]|uniref:pilus assembly protein TadG-related protein n=1 Tax=Glutamicibacter nicotianae TaxID=37929 RepID=UPI00307A6BF3
MKAHPSKGQVKVPRSHDERGSNTMLGMVFAVALLLATGLVIDGGAKIAGSQEAQNVAEAAARAGAGRISPESVNGQAPVISSFHARRLANEYIQAAGLTGNVSTTSNTVTVTVNKSTRTIFLSALGIDSLPSSATATAELRKQ